MVVADVRFRSNAYIEYGIVPIISSAFYPG
jgi:hypothetical protein